MSENVKEIDLLVLFIRFFQFCKKRFLVLLIAGFIGGGAGFLVYSLLPDTYQYNISGIATEIPADVIVKTVNSSNKYFTNKNDSVVNPLAVSKTLFNKVIKISASIEDEESNDLKFELVMSDHITKSDAELLILSILKSNNYINEMLTNKHGQTERIIGFLDEQIKSYDQLPAKVLAEEGIIIQGDETPTDLFIKKEQYKFRLNYLQPVTINNFPVLPEQTKKSYILFSLIGAILLLALTMLYFALIKINHMAVNLNKQSLSVINYTKSA
jgi:hypothetical protein